MPLYKRCLSRHSTTRFNRLLQRCARIDAITKGQQPGNVWDELQTLSCGGLPDPDHPNALLAWDAPMPLSEMLRRLESADPALQVDLELVVDPGPKYYRAVVSRRADGELTVAQTGKSGSALLHTMSDANCFIVLPHDGESVEPGQWVDVQPFHGLV